MIEIAVVGGGPAGSYCAYSLAKNGFHPIIFDHTHPREKPCGGLIMPFVQNLFPFLKEIPVEHGEKNKIHLISPSGRHTCLLSRKFKIYCFSRLKLDQFLVDMAVKKGSELVKEQVIAIKRKMNFWKFKTTKGFYEAKILVGADGVNSLVRRCIIGSLSRIDKGVCCGYFLKGLEKEDVTIKFLAHRKGYIWVIPRDDHTSLGIGTSEISRSYGLRQELDLFIKQQYPYEGKISRWSALIPSIKNVKTFLIPVAGSNWILIGDAAGHVNPIWGEGIMYALFGGELAAQAIIEKNPRKFNELWREAYGSNLFLEVKLRKWIYTKPGLELQCKIFKLQNMLFD